MTESCQWCVCALAVELAGPSQRRDGGVVESSRNWPGRYCRPAKIITCWNGNPVCRAEMDQEMVAKDILACRPNITITGPNMFSMDISYVEMKNDSSTILFDKICFQ